MILTHLKHYRRTRSALSFCSSGPLCRSRRGRMGADATETDPTPAQTEKPLQMKTATSPSNQRLRKESFSLTRSCPTRALHTRSFPCCSTAQELRVTTTTVQAQLAARKCSLRQKIMPEFHFVATPRQTESWRVAPRDERKVVYDRRSGSARLRDRQYARIHRQTQPLRLLRAAQHFRVGRGDHNISGSRRDFSLLLLHSLRRISLRTGRTQGVADQPWYY